MILLGTPFAYSRLIGLALILTLGGCASSPAAKLSTAGQWQRVSEDAYKNPQSGQRITRAQYSELVAGEVYAKTFQFSGNRNAFCR